MTPSQLREAVERALPCDVQHEWCVPECPGYWIDRVVDALLPLCTDESLDAEIERLRSDNAELLAARDADALMISQAGRDFARLRAVLRWTLDQIADGAAGVPPHDCGYIDNPPAGYCEFHDKFTDAVRAAGVELEDE